MAQRTRAKEDAMRLHRSHCKALIAGWIILVAVAASGSLRCVAEVEPPPPSVTIDDIIASTHAGDLRPFNDVTYRLEAQNKRLVRELVRIVSDPKSPNLARCFASYFLGETRVPEAAGALANEITLTMDFSGLQIDMLPSITEHPAMDALIKIGCPSIPVVIRNLGDSDDALVRDVSLKVLYRVEGDKEIARLRLQHALDAQKDAKKQARLQSALKSLSEMQPGK
jgi:hypothetical protein